VNRRTTRPLRGLDLTKELSMNGNLKAENKASCIRLARERQVNVRVVPTGKAIEESVELAHEIYNGVFRKIPEILRQNEGVNR
jgi:hypothetical protein